MLLFRPIAALNRRLRAVRILPFVRGNGVAVTLLAMVGAFAGSESWEALRSTRDPSPTTLDRILGPGEVMNPHVEVSGLVFPRCSFTYAHGPGRPPVFVYVAMLDPGERKPRVLLVRFPGDLGHGEPRELIVSGMLQPFDPRAATKLQADGWTVAGLPVERRYVLVSGAKPIPVRIFVPVAAISVALALALVVAMILERARAPKEASPT